ncbi:MAG: hypothetical protein GY870_04860, partial [archaeon]|nr:hypothetical protein [archaeon]
MEKRLSKIKGLYLGVLIYYSILLIIGLIRWTNSEYGFTQTDDIQYFLDSIFSTLSLFTGLHLLNRSKKFEGQFKKLFIFTGFTFFIIFFIFFYHLIDVIWEWVFEIGFIRQLNFLMDPPGLKFDLIFPFALPFQIISGSSSNTGVISINSSFTFLISLVSLLLYMYPMEKYVKGSKNLWHSIWILITILLIPIFLIILKFDFLGQSNLILSIGCDFILMSYMFNILWIMLLYLKISIKS